MRARHWSILASCVVALATPACGDGEKVVGAYTGRLEGSPAFVAIEIGDRLGLHRDESTTPLEIDGTAPKVVAYVCDDGTVAEWFTGLEQKGEVELRSRGGATLSARIAEDRATGTVTVGGRTFPFTAPRAGRGGLFREEDTANGARRLSGWIVLPDGQTRGASVVGGKVEPAPTFVPTRREITPY